MFSTTRERNIAEIVRSHIGKLQREIEKRRHLAELLAGILESLNRLEEPSAASLFAALEVITMLDRYLSPEQLGRLRHRRAQLGEAHVTQAEQERATLLEQIEAARRDGLAPNSPAVRAAAGQLKALFLEFAGDREVAKSLIAMIESEGIERASGGAVSAALAEYLRLALT